VFEKIGRLAERLATNVGESRRGFLGRLGRGALAAAALLGGVFVSSAAGQSGVVCCVYQCPPRPNNPYFYPPKKVCQAAGTTCAQTYQQSCSLAFQFTAATCGKC
jgi:hypothetical protein